MNPVRDYKNKKKTPREQISNGVKIIHKELAEGRWFQLSLAEQLANIGSEVSRACKWQKKNQKIFQQTVERALELFDLTLEDSRWIGRFREIARVREVFCDAITGGGEYKSKLEDIDKYLFHFAFLSRN